MKTTSLACLLAFVGFGAFYACASSGGGGYIPDPGATSPTGGSTTVVVVPKPTPTGTVDLSNDPAPPNCGNGILTSDEACDDGNNVSGDGCLANCLQVELGWSCVPAGQPCHQIARCGDTVLVFPELCDDGNTADGDGCSSGCKFELGWKCDGAPSVCTHTTCGDGVKEGAESCDDGNAAPYDGCSSECQNEPQCGAGACASACGDGIVMGEACDDGNNISGDGCSDACKIEAGFVCNQPALGDEMKVPMVVRDFGAGGDFEKGGDFAKDLNYANQGLLKDTLEGAGRKPVLASTTGKYDGTTGKASGIASPASFAMWYDESAPASGNTRNKSLVTKLNLYLKSDGSAYVNRYGNSGDGLTSAQFRLTEGKYCGEIGKEDHDTSGNALPCTVCYYTTGGLTEPCTQHDTTPCQTEAANWSGECVKNGTQWNGIFVKAAYDGNPLFFPADSLTPASAASTAQISGNYDPSWPADPTGKTHNFSFTTEVRYWFSYDSAKTFKLRFVGDDDVWVFINNKLAVDLGGIHTAVQGDLTFGGSGAATVVITPVNPTNGSKASITTHPDLGVANGNVYEIVVLHAERQTKASSYQLTLSGFNAALTDCRAVCGDGIVGIGEECDDGVNDGGYGECGAECRLGEYCGDGIVQSGEDCDDGVNVGNPCPSGCRKLVLL
jgi:fibro-slime domain-containing protein